MAAVSLVLGGAAGFLLAVFSLLFLGVGFQAALLYWVVGGFAVAALLIGCHVLQVLLHRAQMWQALHPHG